MKVLIVVDMQNDFVTGVLGTEEAKSIVPNVVGKIEEYRHYGEGQHIVYFTRDTHSVEYLESEEGKNLPVPHCLRDEEGWEFIPELKDYLGKVGFIEVRKGTFGSHKLLWMLRGLDFVQPDGSFLDIESVELIGVCTDICVISNAIIAKSALPDVPIYVDASCCAGVTPEVHDKAIDLMKNSLQIHILNEGQEPWREKCHE